MKRASYALTLMLAVAWSLAAVANILSEDAFWNKDEVYVPPAPAVAESTLTEGTYEPFSAWDLILLFDFTFRGGEPKGVLFFVN